MLYMIIGVDHEDSLNNRLSVRSEHIARLEQLKTAGRLILAGPNPSIDCNDPGTAGFSGSLIVAEFESLAEAQLWADNDPYTKNQVYKHVTVKPFKHVLP